MILITGSSGMIGTALAESLLADKADFLGLDRRPNDWSQSAQQQTVMFDMLNSPTEELLDKLRSAKVDIIIHLAANARVFDLIKDPNLAVENVITTNRVYDIARKLDIKKIIIASSREVYGDVLTSGHEGKINEAMAHHLNCANQYSASKLFGESLAQGYRRTDGLETIIARFSNVYGRYDTSDRFVPLVIRKIMKQESLEIYGGKDKAMDFTYIDDTIAGLRLLIENFDDAFSQDNHQNVYNISSGCVSTLYNVATKLMELMDAEIEIKLVANRPGEPMFYQADIARIAKLGYQPKHTIETGLSEAVKYYRQIYK